jgi:hypothetical protein
MRRRHLSAILAVAAVMAASAAPAPSTIAASVPTPGQEDNVASQGCAQGAGPSVVAGAVGAERVGGRTGLVVPFADATPAAGTEVTQSPQEYSQQADEPAAVGAGEKITKGKWVCNFCMPTGEPGMFNCFGCHRQ